MVTKLLPTDATDTTLDMFEIQPLLPTFDNAFTQKVGPYSPDDPMLEFEVLCGRNNFMDLQILLFEIKCKTSRNNDGNLRTGTEVANTDAPYLSSSALNSLNSESTVSANDLKVSNKYGN